MDEEKIVCPYCGSEDIRFLIFGWKCNECGRYFLEAKLVEGDDDGRV